MPGLAGQPQLTRGQEEGNGGVRPGETKAQRFERIAERRVNETLRALRLLGNLSDRRNYAYTDEQVALIVGAIDEACRRLKSKFKTESVSDRQGFRFK